MVQGVRPVRFKTGKAVSRFLGISTFLLLLLLKGAFPKAAYAFLSSVDTCAAQPQCAGAISSELAPIIAAPTAEAGGAIAITTTTATGASTSVDAVAGVTVVGDIRLSGLVAYYIWNQGQNGQAQNRAIERYCNTKLQSKA